jgi:hypothetical protein
LRFELVVVVCLLAQSAVRADAPVRVLIVDGNGAAGAKKGGDAYYIDNVLKSLKNYESAVKDVSELEKPDLKSYSVIFLLNVPELSAAARANLENHVKAGGGAAFFLGDKVKPAHYNRLLYKKGEGIFPVMLAEKPTEAPAEKKKPGSSLSPHPAVYLRNAGHEICSGLNELRFLFGEDVFQVDRHYPIARPKSGYSERVRELIAFPNEDEVEPFKDEGRKLMRLLPVEDDAYKEYRASLTRHNKAVRTVLFFGKKAWELGDALDELLADKGDPEDAERPDLTGLWQKADIKELHQKLSALRDKSRYADPLVVAAQFGKGRVAVCLTTAGSAWSDWADGLTAPTFVMVTANIVKYLTGDGEKRP